MKKWTDRMETPIQAELICYDVNGIHIVFGVTKEKALKLFHFSSAPFDAENLCRKPDNWWPMEGMREAQIEESFQLVQVNFSGYNRPYEKHGNKYIVTAPGFMLKFDSILEERNEDGDLLRIVQKDDVTGARVESVMQFYDGLPVARMYNTVTNEGSENQTLEYISSFSYWGIEKEQKEGIPEFISSDDKMSMIVVHNGWQKELTVKKYRFADLGMAQTQPHNYQRTSKTIEITNTGNWSAKEYVPMGYIGNSVADASLFFEIDHSGSWHYEIGDQNCHFYLAVSGPTEIQSHWSKNLKPGDSFTTVPVAVGVGHDDFEEAIGTLTKYRRRIRRPNKDNENLPVIFNDYMNCLFGDPTTEKEFPLVDAAEKAGCEYFVIDAGWDADGTLPPARRAAARAAVWEAFFRQDLALLPATLPDALRASSAALLTDFAAQDYTLLGTVLEFLANNSALPHAEALPGAWDAKAGTYTVTDASRAAVQTFLSVSPASGNDASLREP